MPPINQSTKALANHHSQSIDSQKDYSPTASAKAISQRNLSLMSSNIKNAQSQIELSAYELDKKKYGALLPKTGVYFLPDERIIAFLK